MSYTRAKTVRARKRHTCELCADTINPGETYERVFEVSEGAAFAWKCCRVCADWYDALWTYHPDIAEAEGHSTLLERLAWVAEEVADA